MKAQSAGYESVGARRLVEEPQSAIVSPLTPESSNDIPDKPVGRGQRGGSVSTPNVKAVQRLFVDREELRLPPPQNLLFPLFDSASVQLDPPLIDDHFRLTTRKDIEAV